MSFFVVSPSLTTPPIGTSVTLPYIPSICPSNIPSNNLCSDPVIYNPYDPPVTVGLFETTFPSLLPIVNLFLLWIPYISPSISPPVIVPFPVVSIVIPFSVNPFTVPALILMLPLCIWIPVTPPIISPPFIVAFCELTPSFSLIICPPSITKDDDTPVLVASIIPPCTFVVPDVLTPSTPFINPLFTFTVAAYPDTAVPYNDSTVPPFILTFPLYPYIAVFSEYTLLPFTLNVPLVYTLV